ncbi:hypothetical protein [Jiangella ureilytica]|uniref:hypothetical protein n=1 Tax=Jiangella ureilytica TaxID=2530374 RepID=UPI0013A5D92E|nr:hypothetical protein [Jiangella ureilytica]
MHRFMADRAGAKSVRELAGASVVIGVSDSPSIEDDIAPRFFETSTRHLLATEREV